MELSSGASQRKQTTRPPDTAGGAEPPGLLVFIRVIFYGFILGIALGVALEQAVYYIDHHALYQEPEWGNR